MFDATPFRFFLVGEKKQSEDQDLFRVFSFFGSEQISEPYDYNLHLVSTEPQIDPQDIVGKSATLLINDVDGKAARAINGIVFSFEQAEIGKRFTSYRINLVPRLKLLSFRHDCRIFQKMTVAKIIEAVLMDASLSAGTDFDIQVSGGVQRDYCVQYRESDLNFISRLMEDEGIFYYLEHKESNHKLVITNEASKYPSISGSNSIKYHTEGSGVADEEFISRFNWRQQLSINAVTLQDYSFEEPNLGPLKVNQKEKQMLDFERYDYPGLYRQPDLGNQIKSTRLNALQVGRYLATGTTSIRRLQAGYQFELKEHLLDRYNQKYVLTTVNQSGESPQVLEEEGLSQSGQYTVDFSAIPAKQAYSPAPKTPRPLIKGIQTAIVVGPKGEEIFTDEHGRVKVQFHWDRDGKRDEFSSCWVRVSQVWAGAGWGAVHIPRIGQEVVVSFEEGDPDRPLIIGRTYHGDNKYPFSLPSDKALSGIKSNSTMGGGGSNELIFDDTKNNELVTLHAEHNQSIEVENDETHWVGRDRKKNVDNNETVTVGADRTENVGKNETIEIGVDRSETVGKNESISIGENRTEQVGKNETITIGVDQSITIDKNQTEQIGENRKINIGNDDTIQIGKKLMINVGDEILIRTGSASLTMKSDGTIILQGKNITLKGSGKITAKASGDIVLKGSKISEN